MRQVTIIVSTVIAAGVALVGCGGSDAPTNETTGAGVLLEVDGRVVESGDTFEIDPAAPGENITFRYGPEVPRAGVKALQASGEIARVSYRLSTEAPVATSVIKAPEFGKDVKSYIGTIVRIDDEEIVLDGPDGERAFDISDADEGAFDEKHIRDHQKADSKLKVYYRGTDDPPSGLAYEDA